MSYLWPYSLHGVSPAWSLQNLSNSLCVLRISSSILAGALAHGTPKLHDFPHSLIFSVMLTILAVCSHELYNQRNGRVDQACVKAAAAWS
jgi:hypothetical protein